jgi:hypothetical protein
MLWCQQIFQNVVAACFSFFTNCMHCEQFYSAQYDKQTITFCKQQQEAQLQTELTAASD